MASTANPTNNKPARIQRRRSKGWTTPYGNPFQIARVAGGLWVVFVDATDGVTGQEVATVTGERQARQIAVDNFQAMLRTPGGAEQAEFFAWKLHGRNLSCWCPIGMPCHADVLLRVASLPAPRPAA